MLPPDPLITDRFDLRCLDPARDVDDLFPIFSDPDGWWYDPDGRHREPAQTKGWLTRAAARFATDQLSYWTVRLRDDGTVIGVGGAQRQRTRAWNLNYRIATTHQGHGYATELGRAAHAARQSRGFRRSADCVDRRTQHAIAQRRRAARPQESRTGNRSLRRRAPARLLRQIHRPVPRLTHGGRSGRAGDRAR
jgi:Acetyltransferase (GNAT) domain